MSKLHVQNTTRVEAHERARSSYLDAAASLLFEQDVLWLEITVDDPVPAQGLQALQDGVCKLSDQRQAETLELVALDELVQVHAQQLKGHADVVAEGEVLEHVHDVHGAVAVLLAQVLQDADLLLRLPVEALLVAHHFQSQVLLQFVVVHLSHLAEATFTDNLQRGKREGESDKFHRHSNWDHLQKPNNMTTSPDLEELVAVSQVIVRDVNVSALLVVVATVVVASGDGRPFLGIGSHEVDIWVGVDLRLLQRGQLRSVQSQSLVGSERAAQLPAVPSVSSSVLAGGFTGALAGFSTVANKQ